MFPILGKLETRIGFPQCFLIPSPHLRKGEIQNGILPFLNISVSLQYWETQKFCTSKPNNFWNHFPFTSMVAPGRIGKHTFRLAVWKNMTFSYQIDIRPHNIVWKHFILISMVATSRIGKYSLHFGGVEE